MHRKQAGITLIGWVFLIAPLALVVYAAIRLVPIYLNYTRVARTVSQVADEAQVNATPAMIRNSIDKRLDIEGIEFPELKDFQITRDGQAWVISVAYEDTAPLIANVKLLVSFSKSARVGGADDGE